jgi:undecaprenyl-phosphate 4-deoxy-4-formamido-L-arabinose transferase
MMIRFALRRFLGAETASKASAFRAFKTTLRGAFERCDNPYVNIDVLLSWATTNFTTISVVHQRRAAGTSQYTIKKLLVHAVNMIIGFSILPLRIATFIGISFALFGALILFYVIGRFLLLHGSVPGFPFLASIISIYSGAQLFAIGILGEYMARMYSRSVSRPAYVVSQICMPSYNLQ